MEVAFVIQDMEDLIAKPISLLVFYFKLIKILIIFLNIYLAQCSQGCIPNQGFCNSTNVCLCYPSYYGADCSISCSRNGTCNGRGNCSSSGQCECDQQWNGSYCTLRNEFILIFIFLSHLSFL